MESSWLEELERLDPSLAEKVHLFAVVNDKSPKSWTALFDWPEIQVLQKATKDNL